MGLQKLEKVIVYKGINFHAQKVYITGTGRKFKSEMHRSCRLLEEFFDFSLDIERRKTENYYILPIFIQNY